MIGRKRENERGSIHTVSSSCKYLRSTSQGPHLRRKLVFGNSIGVGGGVELPYFKNCLFLITVITFIIHVKLPLCVFSRSGNLCLSNQGNKMQWREVKYSAVHPWITGFCNWPIILLIDWNMPMSNYFVVLISSSLLFSCCWHYVYRILVSIFVIYIVSIIITMIIIFFIIIIIIAIVIMKLWLS